MMTKCGTSALYMVIDDSPSWTEQLGNGLLGLEQETHLSKPKMKL